MSDEVILGFDSSNYTTSLAVLDSDGRLLINLKRLLEVDKGERGLRQSDAVFAHIKNYPELLDEASGVLSGKKVIAVGVSNAPRKVIGSYMPCFLVGENLASSASFAASCPLYRFSHQCGHISAALFSSGDLEYFHKPFAAFHVSGGTTELLRVTPVSGGFDAEIVGGTKDISAGQLVDRIGVKMGLGFPSGAAIEELARKNNRAIPKRKVTREGLFLNLSGVENISERLYRDTNDKSLTAAFVLDYIGRALVELSEEYINCYGDTHFIYAGGVMSNFIIKEMLKSRFSSSFAEPRLSSDNAVGIAYLAYLSHLKQ